MSVGADVVTAVRPVPLRCPYCGEGIGVILSRGDEVESIDCKSFGCDASWSSSGEVIWLPRNPDGSRAMRKVKT